MSKDFDLEAFMRRQMENLRQKNKAFLAKRWRLNFRSFPQVFAQFAILAEWGWEQSLLFYIKK